MTASYTPSAEDAVTAYHMHLRRKGPPYLAYLVLAGVMTIILSAVAYWLDVPPLPFLSVFMGGVIILLEWNIVRMIRKHYLKGPRCKIDVKIDDGNIEIASTESRLSHKLSLITKASFDSRGVLLYTGTENYFFIPSRAFTSSDDLSALKQILLSEMRK